MSAELVDPFATHEPTLTPDEWVAIREEIWRDSWDDRALFPACLLEAVKVLGDIGLQGDPQSRRMATQCLRGMAYRAKTGAFPNEPREPAWSLDTRSTCSHPRSNHGDGRGCEDENCPRHGGAFEEGAPDMRPLPGELERPYERTLSDGDGDLG